MLRGVVPEQLLPIAADKRDGGDHLGVQAGIRSEQP
jgi:hypothetical protein